MPFVIPRSGPVEPKEVSPLTAEQRAALWEHIVLSYCQKNEDKLRALAQEAVEVPA
jgi:hypothetical protein